MNPLQAEIYNTIYEAGKDGLRLSEIYSRSTLAVDAKDAAQAVHELREEGKVIWISKDGHKRYLAGTIQHIEALKADAAKKREASKAPPPPPPPPARDIRGRKDAEKEKPWKVASEPSAMKGLVESAEWKDDCIVFSVRVYRKNFSDVNLVGHEIQLVKGARS